MKALVYKIADGHTIDDLTEEVCSDAVVDLAMVWKHACNILTHHACKASSHFTRPAAATSPLYLFFLPTMHARQACTYIPCSCSIPSLHVLLTYHACKASSHSTYPAAAAFPSLHVLLTYHACKASSHFTYPAAAAFPLYMFCLPTMHARQARTLHTLQPQHSLSTCFAYLSCMQGKLALYIPCSRSIRSPILHTTIQNQFGCQRPSSMGTSRSLGNGLVLAANQGQLFKNHASVPRMRESTCLPALFPGCPGGVRRTVTT